MPKYKVTISPARMVKMYKAGKNVSQIAQAVGYPRGRGQNRCRAVLLKAGVYKAR